MTNNFSVEVLENQCEISKKYPIISIKGEIDVHNCPKITDTFNEMIKEGKNTFVLNLKETSYIDSTGLGTIAKAAQKSEPNKGEIMIVYAQDHVKKLFEISGLSKKNITLFENEKELLNQD